MLNCSRVYYVNYVREWTEVLSHVQSVGHYKPASLSTDRGWANQDIADS